MALCIAKDRGCQVRYDDQAKQVMIEGDEADIQGVISYENFLFLRKLPGLK